MTAQITVIYFYEQKLFFTFFSKSLVNINGPKLTSLTYLNSKQNKSFGLVGSSDAELFLLRSSHRKYDRG